MARPDPMLHPQPVGTTCTVDGTRWRVIACEPEDSEPVWCYGCRANACGVTRWTSDEAEHDLVMHHPLD